MNLVNLLSYLFIIINLTRGIKILKPIKIFISRIIELETVSKSKTWLLGHMSYYIDVLYLCMKVGKIWTINIIYYMQTWELLTVFKHDMNISN